MSRYNYNCAVEIYNIIDNQVGNKVYISIYGMKITDVLDQENIDKLLAQIDREYQE
jgi:hypothetical protein